MLKTKCPIPICTNLKRPKYDLFCTHIFYLCIGDGVVCQKYEHFVDKSTQKYTVRTTDGVNFI